MPTVATVPELNRTGKILLINSFFYVDVYIHTCMHGDTLQSTTFAVLGHRGGRLTQPFEVHVIHIYETDPLLTAP